MSSTDLDIDIPFTINVNVDTGEQDIMFHVQEIEVIRAYLKCCGSEDCFWLRTICGHKFDDDEYVKSMLRYSSTSRTTQKFRKRAWDFCVNNAFSQSTRSFKVCNFCRAHAHRICSICKDVYYCGEACQLTDWKAHKKECLSPSTASSSSSSLTPAGGSSPSKAHSQ